MVTRRNVANPLPPVQAPPLRSMPTQRRNSRNGIHARVRELNIPNATVDENPTAQRNVEYIMLNERDNMVDLNESSGSSFAGPDHDTRLESINAPIADSSMNANTATEPIRCLICDQVFASNDELNIHRRSHRAPSERGESNTPTENTESETALDID